MAIDPWPLLAQHAVAVTATDGRAEEVDSLACLDDLGFGRLSELAYQLPARTIRPQADTMARRNFAQARTARASLGPWHGHGWQST
jgi:hypothetical protein